MTAIQRYYFSRQGDIEPNDNGQWVHYDDHTRAMGEERERRMETIAMCEQLKQELAEREAAVWEDAAKLLDAERESILKEWEADPDIPSSEHESEDCKGHCDMFCYAHNTLGALANDFTKQAQQARGRREK